MNKFKIDTTNKYMNIEIDGNPLRLVPQIIVWGVNHFGLQKLADLKEMLRANKDWTVDGVLKYYPLSKNLSFIAKTTEEQFNLKAKGVKNREDVQKIVIVALLTADLEDRDFLCDVVKTFFEEHQELTDADRINRIAVIFHQEYAKKETK